MPPIVTKTGTTTTTTTSFPYYCFYFFLVIVTTFILQDAILMVDGSSPSNSVIVSSPVDNDSSSVKRKVSSRTIHNNENENENSHRIIMSNKNNNKNNDGRNDVTIIFSDLDGTLIHYPSSSSNKKKASTTRRRQNEPGNQLIKLPPSSTGMRGIISSKTLSYIQEIRKMPLRDGSSSSSNKDSTIKFVLISGMRTSTFLKRLPYLPRADAYCTEAGGRIFYPVPSIDDNYDGRDGNDDDNDDGTTNIVGLKMERKWSSSSHNTVVSPPPLVVRPKRYDGTTKEDLQPFTIVEDMEWRKRIEQVAGKYDGGSDILSSSGSSSSIIMDGTVTEDITKTTITTIGLNERDGLLWDFARHLIADEGFVIDMDGYSSCFRINRKQQTSPIMKEKFDTSLINGKIKPWKGLASSINLSCIDFYPERSGKKNCCLYLVSKFFFGDNDTDDNNDENDDGDNSDDTTAIRAGAVRKYMKSHALCICDDDNDLEMAVACKHAYLPELSSNSIRDIINHRPDQFTVTGGGGTGTVLDDEEQQHDDDDLDGVDDTTTGVGVSGTDATEAALLLILEQVTGPSEEMDNMGNSAGVEQLFD